MNKFYKLVLIGGLSTTILCGCETKQETGTAVGAGAGALVGSLFGRGTGQIVATGIGAIAGAVIGGSVGTSMDKTDSVKAQKVFEYTPTGQPTTWTNPGTSRRYSVTPTKTYYRAHTQPCRDYTMYVTMADGDEHTVYGRACRQKGGSWTSVNNDSHQTTW